MWTSERFGPRVAAPALIAFSLGGVIGAAVLDRALVRVTSRTAVLVSSSLCVMALAGWLLSPNAYAVLGWGFVVGAAATPLHPLAKSEAFATLPSRPGLVNGAARAFVAIDIIAPIVLAWLAEHIGPRGAIATLAVQPVALWLLALSTRGRCGRRGGRDEAC